MAGEVGESGRGFVLLQIRRNEPERLLTSSFLASHQNGDRKWEKVAGERRTSALLTARVNRPSRPLRIPSREFQGKPTGLRAAFKRRGRAALLQIRYLRLTGVKHPCAGSRLEEGAVIHPLRAGILGNGRRGNSSANAKVFAQPFSPRLETRAKESSV